MQIEESKGLISRYILVELDTLRQKYPSQQEKWITLKDKINSWIQQHTGAFTITDYTNSILSSALVECHINLEEYSATNPLLEGGLSIKSLDSIVIAAYLAFVKDKSKEKSYQILSLIEDIDLKQYLQYIYIYILYILTTICYTYHYGSVLNKEYIYIIYLDLMEISFIH